MKKIIALLLALTMVISMGAEGASAAEFKWPGIFVVNTTGSTSAAYSQTLAWATVVEKETGMAVRLLPEDSNNTKFRRVKLGEVDCMYDTITDAANVVQAIGGFQTADGGPYSIRNLWIDNIQVGCFVVRGDSKIETLKDITTSTKIAYWPDPSIDSILRGIGAATGLDWKEFTLIPCSAYTDMIKMVADGSAEFCPYITPNSSALIEAAANVHGIRVIELNPEEFPEACAAWRTVFPTHGFNQIVVGYEGAQGKYGCSNYAGLWTRAGEDEETVYNLIKFFVENKDAIIPGYESFQFYWNLDTFMEFANLTPVPIHEGVIKYLEEIGEWNEALQARQDYNVKLVDWYTELYQEAIAAAKEQKIEVSIENDAWEEFWTQYKEDAGIPAIRIMSDEEVAAAVLER